MTAYERLSPRFRPKRELRPLGSSEGLHLLPGIDRLCIPTGDARGSVLDTRRP